MEYGLLCVSTTASGLSDGQIASAQLGRARVVLSVLRSEQKRRGINCLVYSVELVSSVLCVELIGSSQNVRQTYLLLSRVSAVFWSFPSQYIGSKAKQILVFCVSFWGARKCFGGSFVHRQGKLFVPYRGRSKREYGHSS